MFEPGFVHMNMTVQQFANTLREASSKKKALRIVGGGTKDFFGNPTVGETLAISAYRGIIEYDPTELVITARAGTPLAEIEAALKDKGQMLAFEPPHFGGNPTLGGCVAAGLSGPRRAYAGAARDLVLGVRMLDGKGTDLRFGGQVMKNVAGFDVSRLMAGSMGTLGVILEVSLKTLPVPQTEITLHQQHTEADVIARMNTWAGQPLPISATAWTCGDCRIRLSGAASAVEAARKKLGGVVVDPALAAIFWRSVRDHTDGYFSRDGALWRLSVKSSAPTIKLPGAQRIEWSGALRWLQTDVSADEVRRAAQAAGGHATLFRNANGGTLADGVFQPLSPALAAIHRRLKQTFDPVGILNPGRLYPGM